MKRESVNDLVPNKRIITGDLLHLKNADTYFVLYVHGLNSLNTLNTTSNILNSVIRAVGASSHPSSSNTVTEADVAGCPLTPI